MCGIAGIFELRERQKTPSVRVLDAMTDSLSHRGPDGRGVYVGEGIGLGHRRLSIIDPTPAGDQPMSVLDSRVVISYNGEIYNFPALRKELEKKGFVFRSQTDTEVILYAYVEWGLECVARLNGIFAFAIWDARDKSLFLARDHLGVKPLFYTEQGGTLSFASEVPALFRNPGVRREVDPIGLDAFLTFSYTPAPLTGYRRVRQLLPGEWLVANRSGVRRKKYWDVPIEAPKHREPPQELAEQFDSLLRRVVKRQLISDVPVGCFLSGGIDSFAMVRTMPSLNGSRTKAFSMGFREPSYDESPLFRIAAESLGVDLDCGYVEPVEDRQFDSIVTHAQEPFADSSMLAVYSLSERTARHVKVVLSGDGCDEILAGYPTYRASKFAPWFRLIPGPIRERYLPALVRALPKSDKKYAFNQLLERFVYGANLGPFRDHAAWRVIATEAAKQRILSREFLERTRESDPLALYEAPMRRVEDKGLSKLDMWLYADLTFYLPNDMLVKVDRMSMAHGIEARVPYLDRELVEFSWRLPTSLKMNWKQDKVLLRNRERVHYPKTLARVRKRGFNVPLASWFRKGFFRLRHDGSGFFDAFLDHDGIRQLEAEHASGEADHGHLLYSLLVLERIRS